MITTNIYDKSEARQIVEKEGIFSIVEYEKDLSVTPDMAQIAYFASKMDVKKRQLVAEIDSEKGVIVQRGMMQMMLGDVEAETNISGALDFTKKLASSVVTKESAVKPLYTGEGTIILEPTFKYIILEDLSSWNSGMIIEDGMFLACEDTIDIELATRKNISSTVLGNEGFFNSRLVGEGVVALESPVPANELIVIDLVDDVVKIDGNMALAWSGDLDFTVKKTTKTLIGSAASGEGFVNVYSGTGRVWVAPVRKNLGISVPER